MSGHLSAAKFRWGEVLGLLEFRNRFGLNQIAVLIIFFEAGPIIRRGSIKSELHRGVDVQRRSIL